MTTVELVNRIVSKLGGNRVEFVHIEDSYDGQTEHGEVQFVHAHNHYTARITNASELISVWRQFLEIPSSNQISEYRWTVTLTGQLIQDDCSRWVQGVLNGLVRNEAGDLVDG